MSDRAPVETTNLDRYGNAPLPWSRAEKRLPNDLQKIETAIFLGTVRPDGRPHAAGIGAAWHDGDIFFTSGPETQKSRNLAANPGCTMSIRLEGLDLVLEGEAVRVRDSATLHEIVKVFQASGWPAEVEGDAFTAPYSAPSAGPPPWHVYRLTFTKAFGVATVEPYGASRWRFDR